MTHRPRLHVDDRGVTRALVDHWLPQLDVDVVWLVGPSVFDEELLRDVVPFIPLSALELATVVAEPPAEATRVLALFSSLLDLAEAAALGLGPDRVVIQHLGAQEGAERISAHVHLADGDLNAVRALQAAGFSFELQSLPIVTARAWAPLAPDP